MPKTKPTTTAAEQRYAARFAELANLMREFEAVLTEHANNQQQDRGNWGYAGDLENYITHFKAMLGRGE